jgi:hypothetical protein
MEDNMSHKSLNERWDGENIVYIKLPKDVTLFVMIEDKHKLTTDVSETDNSVVIATYEGMQTT